MKAFGNGAFRRLWQQPGAWRLLLVAAFPPSLLPLGSSGGHATGAAASAARQYLSAGTATWTSRSFGTGTILTSVDGVAD
jgi:hypothetical protein